MSLFLSPSECTAAIEQTALFLDTMRDYSCDALKIMKRQNARPGILLGLATSDEKLLTAGDDFLHRPLPEADIFYYFMLHKGKLKPDRPRASDAVRALGSVAGALPVDIIDAGGFLLDTRLVVAPQLTIHCAVGESTIDQFSAFLENHEHRRDSQGSPHIITEHLNAFDRPIEVELHLSVF